MKRYLSLYYYFLIQRFKILMEYRLNFFIGATSTIVVQAASLVAVWGIMRQIPSLNGWSFEQVLLVYGLITLAKSINHMFADNLWTIGQYIRHGGFERFLVRPVNPLFHLLADRFCHDGIGNFLVGIVLVAQSGQALHIPWTILNLAYLVLAVVSGGLIFIALNLITATSVFWLMESLPITKIIFNTSEFAKYPLDIYGKGISVLMTWIIPYGFASFYPASYLLGKPVGILAWLGIPFSVLLMLFAYQVWKIGLRHYTGTGT